MSILKLKDSQGNWVGVPTLKGDKGNGISSAVLNNDYTLTLTFTDGTTYTTPSIRGEKGEQGEPATDMNIHICSVSEYDSETRIPTITSPDDKTFYLVPTEDGTSPDLFTEWVYVNNAWEMFGSASVDLIDYVKNTDYATLNQGGVVKVGGLGITITNGEIKIQPASSSQIKRGSGDTAPINASKEHEATFYGLAKAAGHDEKDSTLPVGQYTDEAKSSIQDMLDVPSTSELKEVNDSKADVIVESVSGDIVSFNDGADDMPLQSLVVNINPVQNLNGYDSPWVGGTRKNKCAPFEEATSDIQYRAIYVGDGTFTASSTAPWDASNATVFFLAGNVSSGASSGGNGIRPTVPVTQTAVDGYVTIAWRKVGDVDPTNYQTQIESGSTATDWTPYENICPISGWTGVNVTSCGKNLLDPTLMKDQVGWNIIKVYAPVGTTLTMSTDCDDVTTSTGLLVFFRQPDGTMSTAYNVIPTRSVTQTVGVSGYVEVVQRNPSGTKSFADYQWQIEVGTTTTAYEPYKGTTIPINWQSEAGTVYGGSLDVLTGVLRIDKAMVDLGTLTWSYQVSPDGIKLPRFASSSIADIISKDIDTQNGLVGETACSVFALSKSVVTSRDMDYTYCALRETGFLYVIDTDYSDKESFKSGMNGVQLLYPLAEPIEIQLSANQINSFYGVNNIWADTGTTSVEYCADTEMYIEKVKPVVNVDDVQINGTSIVDENGVANVPIASNSALGAVRSRVGDNGIQILGSGYLGTYVASDSDIKNGIHSYRPLSPNRQHAAAFYGLAKASGDTTQSASSNAVGNYTEEAKASIQNMLGITDKYSPKEWVAESETELVANAHNVGDLFYIGETLYKVIADLNAGDAINVGVNVEEVNVNDILDDYATKEDVQDNVSIVEKSTSGSIASFSDGADGLPLKSLIVNIDPVQDLHGYDSPWVAGGGKNLFDQENVTVTGSGVVVLAKAIPAGTYTISALVTSTDTDVTYNRINLWDENNAQLAAVSLTRDTRASASFTIASACAKVVFYAASTAANSSGDTATFTKVQIESGNTATDWTPYENICPISGWTGMQLNANGTVIPISWLTEAGTVYGGKLDVLSGVLTIDKIGVDLSAQTWNVKATGTTHKSVYTQLPKPYVGHPRTSENVFNPILEQYTKSGTGYYSGTSDAKITNPDAQAIGCLYYSNSNNPNPSTIYLIVEIDDSPSGLIVYNVAEPITIQLDAHTINSLLGTNNIFADTGDTSVEYFSQVDKDLIDYIETSLKPYAKEERLNDYVSDVQVNGTSIVENGIAEIPFATSNAGGVVKVDSSLGIKLNDTTKLLLINRATTTQTKAGRDSARPIVPICQHESVFYGLTKAAGVDMSSSSNAIGTYTEEAKTAIKQMLGIHDTIDSFVEEVTGTDVIITGQPSYRYNCGEVLSLSITPPESGTIDIRFTSGSTPTVLTLPSTVKMPEWWVEVETNTIYEMCITDGIYCGVMTWAI